MLVRGLVGQSLGHVFLILGVCRLLERGTIFMVIVLQHFKDSIFLIFAATIIVNAVVKYCGDVIFRIVLLEEMIVLDSLRYVLCGQYGMELTITAKHWSFFHNLLHHRPMVLI